MRHRTEKFKKRASRKSQHMRRINNLKGNMVNYPFGMDAQNFSHLK